MATQCPLVVDLGSVNTAWGFAGDDEPRQADTAAWCTIGDDWASRPADFLELREAWKPQWLHSFDNLPAPLQAYMSQCNKDDPAPPKAKADWGIQGSLSKSVLAKELEYVARFYNEDANGKSIVCVQPTRNSSEYTAALAECALEKINYERFSAVRKAAAGAFGLGRQTACVVETGPVTTTISPVYDGHILHRNVLQFLAGGILLDWALASSVNLYDTNAERFVSSFNPYRSRSTRPGPFNGGFVGELGDDGGEEWKAAGVDERYWHASCRKIIDDMKRCCLSAAHQRNDKAKLEQENAGSYELPDGRILELKPSVTFGVSEFLFNPSDTSNLVTQLLNSGPANSTAGNSAGGPSSSGNSITNFPGVPSAAVSCVFSCDVDLRASLLQNICVVGGPSSMAGFMERMAHELSALSHTDLSVRDRLGLIKPTNLWDVQPRHLPSFVDYQTRVARIRFKPPREEISFLGSARNPPRRKWWGLFLPLPTLCRKASTVW